jgi:Uma2 family endonuclease
MAVLAAVEREVAETIPLPDHYEVVHGEVVGVRELSRYSSEVANVLRDHLYDNADLRRLGRIRHEMLFHVPLPDDATRKRKPDCAFISYERWPRDLPLSFTENAADVVPDLAAEVASPTDAADDLFDKAEEYLTAGVRVVWVLIPRTRLGLIFEPGRDPRAVRVSGELDGGTAFPTLRVPMATLFPPVIAGT